LYQPSYQAVIAPIAGGSAIAVVYLDMTFIENRRMTGRPYLSVLGNNRSACSDIPITGSTDPLPNLAFQGDTLLVLTQEVRDTTSTTVLRRYHVRAGVMTPAPGSSPDESRSIDRQVGWPDP
jgi:hypothetical protein